MGEKHISGAMIWYLTRFGMAKGCKTTSPKDLQGHSNGGVNEPV